MAKQKEREYHLKIVVRTDEYEENLEELVMDALGDYGLEVESVDVENA